MSIFYGSVWQMKVYLELEIKLDFGASMQEI